MAKVDGVIYSQPPRLRMERISFWPIANYPAGDGSTPLV
jgi:hypothetical protein